MKQHPLFNYLNIRTYVPRHKSVNAFFYVARCSTFVAIMK